MYAAIALLLALTRFWSGNREDVHPPLHGPVLDLAGSDAEERGLQVMIDDVRGCGSCEAKLDVAVIRASGAEGLNRVFMSLQGVNSVVTLLITDRDSANRRDIERIVNEAEIVWFAGGDQCNYIRWIKNTRVHHAVKRVFARGGGVGGNSAGLAIQGDVVYDACPDQSAASKDVLANPFHVDVSLSTDFFRWTALRDTITDTHFHQRDRLGRLLVFLARTYEERRRRMDGLGIDEDTSIIVSPDGKGRVIGDGAAYLIVADHPAEVLRARTPLTYRGFKIWKFRAGDTIDLVHRPTAGARMIDVLEGKLSADPY
jgi:cyanophycinase